MSITGLFAIGVSGVNAYATRLEATAQNIANSQTVGYKRAHTEFSDLIAASTPNTGGGVSAANRTLLSEQGALTRTETATNAAISGAGFFVVSETPGASGGVAPFLFTRAGDFAPNTAGDLVNGAGYYLQGFPLDAAGAAPNGALTALETINIFRRPALPAGAPDPGPLAGLSLSAEGRLVATYENGESYALYRVPVALFTNDNGLGEGPATAFLNATAAGGMVLVNPGAGRAGHFETSAIEISTVDIGREFSALIETQRAYATNARVISVADELWRRVVETAA